MTKGFSSIAISASSRGSLYLECHLIAYNFAGNTVDCVGAFRGKCPTERKICRSYYSHWRFGRLNSMHVCVSPVICSKSGCHRSL